MAYFKLVIFFSPYQKLEGFFSDHHYESLEELLQMNSDKCNTDSFGGFYVGISALSSVQFSSVQFSRSVVFDSLRPHRLQHARLPYPSPTPGAYSNSYLSSQWCHPTISSCQPLILLPSIFPCIFWAPHYILRFLCMSGRYYSEVSAIKTKRGIYRG